MPRAVATLLMFDGGAEEAMNWYVSVIRDSTITKVDRYAPGEQGPLGAIKRAELLLAGHRVICFDSPVKHAFTFTPSTSIFVDCSDEAELDAMYNQLSTGGDILMPLGNYGFSQKFGWVKDRFGVSWQVNLP